jgi:molecular chaperone GrpE
VIEELRQELKECQNRELRLKADFDNFRRRTNTQLEEERLKYKQLFARDLLEILDNFERALIDDQAAGDTQFREGILAIQSQLGDVLRSHGVVPMEAEPGTPFDPQYHEVLDMADDTELPALSVKQVYQRGYMFKDKVLRPARVQVVNDR